MSTLYLKVVATQADAIIQDRVRNLGMEIQRLRLEKTLEIRKISSQRKYVYTDLDKGQTRAQKLAETQLLKIPYLNPFHISSSQ